MEKSIRGRPDGGLSEAIWNVLYSKVASIQVNYDNQGLILLERGNPGPVCDLSWGDYAIYFTWPAT